MGDTLWTRGLAALRGFLSGGTVKTTIVDADYIAIYDSAAATIKRVSFLTLKNQTLGDINGLVYKGVINCAASPNYPAADGGHVYFVSVAGKIGGISGTVVEAGDMLICNTDGSVAGDQATVGTNWEILQKNIDLGNISITGGTVDNTTIGGTTPATGTFTLLKGNTDEIIKAASDTLTAAECKGQIINNYGQSAENTQTLPAAAKGMHGTVCISTAGAGAFHLKAGPSDKIYLDGVAIDDGGKVSLATPAVGNFFSYFSFQNGASVYDWQVVSGSGTLTDGGA